MEENSLTIAILREIRDNTAKTNERVDHLTNRVDHLTERVDHLTERVDHLAERVDHLTERVDHLTERVGSIESLTQTMAAVQVRQEQLLVRLAKASERHEGALVELVRETKRIHDRIDNIFDGPVSNTLRDHETRIRRLEGRDD